MRYRVFLCSPEEHAELVGLVEVEAEAEQQVLHHRERDLLLDPRGQYTLRVTENSSSSA